MGQSETPLSELSASLAALSRERGMLRDWSSWCAVRRKAIASNLEPLVAEIEAGSIAPAETGESFRLAYARWWLKPALDGDPVLRDFRRFQHEHAITDFRTIDDLVRAATPARVASAVAHGLPSAQSVPRRSELGLLRHQMELRRPSRTIRELIGDMPTTFSRLAPCMLMSPLSIAQYLPPDQALFDVVIFDEASQITTWDAVGAIARGRQTIIVGDPKQLPPTNFFGASDGDGDDETPSFQQDLESILDEARASGIPMRDLRWHYRSRHESLIAFSNSHYYENRLVTFPSPMVDDRAVRMQHLPHSVYDGGTRKSRTNPIEARAVADEAVRRMRGWLKLPEGKRPTLGIITFNVQQQTLILDLLDEARRNAPELEWFFADDRFEPTFVKNLENVQGDERDVILFSVTFTTDAAGKLGLNFGALNKTGGERRLNVAITRARQELIVFSGMLADQIAAERSKSLGVRHFKAFLDYAARGAAALPAQDDGSLGDHESPFEEMVAEALDRLGWQIVPQVGISGFRVDLGIKHPDRAGSYLAGIECDGAAYHSSATARDRDKVREQVLRGLGWNILRVWSTDWWFDADGASQRLHAALNDLLDQSRRVQADVEPTDEAATGWDLGHEIEPVEPDASPAPTEPEATPPGSDGDAREPEDESQPFEAVRSAARPAESVAPYRITDLSHIAAEPDRFHDFDYRDTLRRMIEAVIDCEAPLREDILAQRIARAHGWLRTGNRIRERIALHLREADRTIETSGPFVWRKGTVVEFLTFRPPLDDDAWRNIAEIPLAELAAVAAANMALLDEPDPALTLARLLNVERLTTPSRARLDEAIARARERHAMPALN